MGPPDLVSASVITTPEATNGAARTIVDIVIAAICAAGHSVTAENGITRFPTCESASVAANTSDAAGSTRVTRSTPNSGPPTKTITAPDAMPSMAIDTAKNDK